MKPPRETPDLVAWLHGPSSPQTELLSTWTLGQAPDTAEQGQEGSRGTRGPAPPKVPASVARRLREPAGGREALSPARDPRTGGSRGFLQKPAQASVSHEPQWNGQGQKARWGRSYQLQELGQATHTLDQEERP